MVNWKELQITLGVMIPQVDFSGPIFNDFNIFNTKYPIFTLFMKNITIILSWIYLPALLLVCCTRWSPPRVLSPVGGGGRSLTLALG